MLTVSMKKYLVMMILSTIRAYIYFCFFFFILVLICCILEKIIKLYLIYYTSVRMRSIQMG